MKFDKMLALVITFMLVLGTIPVIASGVKMAKREDVIEYESYEMELEGTQLTIENILMVLRLIDSGTVYKVDLTKTTSTTTYEVGETSSLGTVMSFASGFDLTFTAGAGIIPGISFTIIGTNSISRNDISTQTNLSDYTTKGVLKKFSSFQYMKIYGIVKVGE